MQLPFEFSPACSENNSESLHHFVLSRTFRNDHFSVVVVRFNFEKGGWSQLAGFAKPGGTLGFCGGDEIPAHRCDEHGSFLAFLFGFFSRCSFGAFLECGNVDLANEKALKN